MISPCCWFSPRFQRKTILGGYFLCKYTFFLHRQSLHDEPNGPYCTVPSSSPELAIPLIDHSHRPPLLPSLILCEKAIRIRVSIFACGRTQRPSACKNWPLAARQGQNWWSAGISVNPRWWQFIDSRPVPVRATSLTTSKSTPFPSTMLYHLIWPITFYSSHLLFGCFSSLLCCISLPLLLSWILAKYNLSLLLPQPSFVPPAPQRSDQAGVQQCVKAMGILLKWVEGKYQLEALPGL